MTGQEPDDPTVTEPVLPSTDDPRWLLPLAVGLAGALIAAAAGFLFLGDDDDGTASPPATLADTSSCRDWDALAPAAEPEEGAFPDLTALRVDEGLQRGEFRNGMRYFVRQNPVPGGSVTLALGVGAGAAIEDDDQYGAAHFLEHMLFNGTEAYPGNELQVALRDLGLVFGADINAFTSEDATVYVLTVPNDDESIDEGLDILLEWATKATLAPDDVDAERDVVLDELRIGLGPEGRDFDRFRDLALAGTDYAEHEVIGSPESIGSMSPEQLRRFYEDWYRPDLMTVFAVGDTLPGAMIDRIEERFRDLDAATGARPVPEFDEQLQDEPRFSSHVDDEVAVAEVELVFSRPSEALLTVEDLERRLQLEIATTALERRLRADGRRGITPVFDVAVSVGEPVLAFEAIRIEVAAEPEALVAAADAVLTEVARIRADGFTDQEVARATTDRLAVAVADKDAARFVPDFLLLQEYLNSALEREAPLTFDALASEQLRQLRAIDTAGVDDRFRELTSCAALGLQAVAPSAYRSSLPSTTVLQERFLAAAAGVDARPAPTAAPTELLPRPEPVPPATTAETFGPGGAARLVTWPNGVRAILVPTGEDTFATVIGRRAGGLAEVADGDVVHARAAAELVSASGVGDLDAVAVDAVLTDGVFAETSIDPDRDQIVAGSTSQGLENALALTHQRMVAPRVDDGAVAAFRGRHRLSTELEARADRAVQTAIDQLLWRDDPRLRTRVTAADLATLDPERAREVHLERFGDASGFDFVIVGGLDIGSVQDLASRYLGTLPGAGRSGDAAAATLPAPPTTIEQRTVEAGAAAQAGVTVIYDVGLDVDPELRDRSVVLEAVLRDSLLTHIREELGATYSPVVRIDADEDHDRVRTRIDVTTAPERVDDVAGAIQSLVNDLRTAGPAADLVDPARDLALRLLAFFDDETLIDTLFTAFDDPVAGILSSPLLAAPRLEGVDVAVVQDLANRLLPPLAYHEVRLRPAG